MKFRTFGASLTARLTRCAYVLVAAALFAELAVAQITGPGGSGGSQQITCTNYVGVIPTLRSEGVTEQTGDIAFNCTGGVPGALGSVIPTVNITVFYNTQVTSRLFSTSPNVSETLLLIDEPGVGTPLLPGFGTGAPLNLCTTALTGCAEFVGQAITTVPNVPFFPVGTSVPVAVDAVGASVAGKNVFQGVVSGNSVTFFGVPVLAPGANSARIFRLTNVRVNANQLNGGLSFVTQVQASISISPGNLLAIQNANPVVGFVTGSLITSVSAASSFSQCSSQTKASVTTLSFAESFGTAFKTRVAAQNEILWAGQNGTPGLNGFAPQNAPGTIYNSESRFVLPIATGQTAGLADFGTRLKAVFNNIPAGVRIFVSTANVQNDTLPVVAPAVIGGSAAVSYAQLVSGETISDGTSFPAATATNIGPNNGNVPIAEIAIVNGSGQAVWEVVNTNPFAIETLKFAVYATYFANPAQNIPPQCTSSVSLSYAPSSPIFTAGSGAVASDTLTSPRYVPDALAAETIMLITNTGCPSLSISKSHLGNFIQGQSGAQYTLTVSNGQSAGITSGTVTVSESVPAGMTLVSMAGTGWTCPQNGTTCTRSEALNAGASYPPVTVTVNVAVNAGTPLSNSASVSGGGSSSSSANDSTIITLGPPLLGIDVSETGNFVQGQNGSAYSVTVTNTTGFGPTVGAVTVNEVVPPGLTLVSMAGTGWNCPIGTDSCTRSDTLAPGASYPVITVTVNVGSNATSPQVYSVSVSGGGAAAIAVNNHNTNLAPPPAALRFVTVTPCRVADTRLAAGPFGGPSISGGSTRDFIVPNSACGIPANAQAYSLNVAVVPAGPLGFLTMWQAGQPRPVASTLNSLDGRVKSNAAIVPAGTGGAISLFASNTTDVVLDINGYFVPATDPTALAFYPITPCRIADTRNPAGPLAGPSLGGGLSRTFPISSTCNLPATARAYSLNFTVVHSSPLGFLTAWPSGQAMPVASSLNALAGIVTANAAIVPAGTGGSIDVFVSNPTDLVIDINGYFAPMSTGGLSLYNVTPCRVVDTRQPAGSPPITSLEVAVSGSACAVPATAQAHVLSMTVVPPAALGFVTLWPQGQTRPVASTLNALDGAITSNLAIVPTNNGSISVFPSNPTQMIVDISGYFGQ